MYRKVIDGSGLPTPPEPSGEGGEPCGRAGGREEARRESASQAAGGLRRRTAWSQERCGPQGRKEAGQETAHPQESSCGREDVALLSFQPSVQFSCSVVSDSL